MRVPLARTSSPPSTDVSPASIRSSVVLPLPLRPDSVSRSRRSSLNDTPRKTGVPAMSLPRSDAIATAIALMVGAARVAAASAVTYGDQRVALVTALHSLLEHG